MEVKDLTIEKVSNGLKMGEFSVEELQKATTAYAKSLNDLNAFISYFEPNNSLNRGNLFGVPIAIKDNILINGTVATAGSKILKNYISPYDATVIGKLKEAGAWFMGKTNLDEFAMGSSTENSAFGPTRHPLDRERVPGGSSGGSAVAVASGSAVCALGSDTGGSIRQPASFCGVVGLKPTYGRVSRHGLMAMASSFDQIGPITKNVKDSAILLSAISGKDRFDSTTADKEPEDFTKYLTGDIKGLKIGIPREFFGEGLDPLVADVIRKAIEKIQGLGAEVEEITLPHTEYAVPTYYVLVPSEVSANLARYDGIRFGYSEKEDSLLEVYNNSRADGFGHEVIRRIMLGTYTLSAGYFDAYYVKAMKVRNLIKRDYDQVFKKFDAVLGPTTPTTAFKLGEKSEDPLSMYLADIYTISANLAGLPAISIPCGNVDGLPVGLQITGKMFDEGDILNIAYAYEQNSK